MPLGDTILINFYYILNFFIMRCFDIKFQKKDYSKRIKR